VILDVTEATFQAEVLDRSASLPVVVDFWAAWCGPCRALTPILEDAVTARAGQIVLAKVDTDANPSLSQSFDIRGIPAVKAFRDGTVVDEFTGVLPPAKVGAFLDGLVPSEASLLVAAGGEEDLRRALELEPGNHVAAVSLARIVAGRGDNDEALRLLDSRPGFAAEGLTARLRLDGDPALEGAFDRLDSGDEAGGLDDLIAALALEPAGDRKDEIRKAIVGVLDELGVEHPLARESRRKLAAALF